MNQLHTRLSAPSLATLLCLSLLSCHSSTHHSEQIVPSNVKLEGRWNCDSSGAAFYNWRHEFINRLTTEPTGGFITIEATRWAYVGKGKEEHAYIRRGDTLLIWRIGDQHLVDMHYIRPDKIGKMISKTDTTIITSLTAHQLILRDSTMDPDGSLIRVWHSYYSR